LAIGTVWKCTIHLLRVNLKKVFVLLAFLNFIGVSERNKP
jgi:hypothetical protein